MSNKALYIQKDSNKFSICNKLISRGAVGSSSSNYAKAHGILAGCNFDSINASLYLKSDVVGVSVNGKRRARISFDTVLLDLAIEAGCLIIKDNVQNTNRAFNLGERELTQYLLKGGYAMHSNDDIRSVWSKIK